MQRAISKPLKYFVRYLLASIIIFQIVPFIYLMVLTLMNGDGLGSLPPYIFHAHFSDLLLDYFWFAKISIVLTLFHLLIRYLFIKRLNPFTVYLIPITNRIKKTWAGRAFLHWILPVCVAFFAAKYLFNVFEEHLEYGVVGCWNTGFPFTYSAGCSTPPISIPGLATPKVVESGINPANMKNLEFYFLAAVFAILYINLLVTSNRRFVKLASRYFASIFLLLTIVPPWLRGYNDGYLLIGKPWQFISHYYEQGTGDVYSFIGSGLAADILLCFLAALLITGVHHFLRTRLNRDLNPSYGIKSGS